MRGKDKHGPEFYEGVRETNINVKQAGVVSNLYPRAKELSGEGVSLIEKEKGYVFGVANRLIDYKGHALDGAELYSSIGELNGGELREKVAKKLIEDVKTKKDYDYLREVQTFMNTNGMKKYSQKLSLEAKLIAPRKREWILPSILVISGVFISGFNMTGNVVGVSNLNSFIGSGLFVFGLVLLLVYLKKDYPK